MKKLIVLSLFFVALGVNAQIPVIQWQNTIGGSVT
ncbi:hypothetical protein LCGC14_1741570, partial [marine sediment metagenome]